MVRTDSTSPTSRSSPGNRARHFKDESLNQTFNLTYGDSRSLADMAKIMKANFNNLEVNYSPKDNLTPDRGLYRLRKLERCLDLNPPFPLRKGIWNISTGISNSTHYRMRIVFFGKGKRGLVCLQKLRLQKENVLLVICQHSDPSLHSFEEFAKESNIEIFSRRS